MSETYALRPLEQWVCDTCGDIIEHPEHGWLGWEEDGPRGARADHFRIVHHTFASPREDGCYHQPADRTAGNHLYYYLGADGLARLLSLFSRLTPEDPEQLEQTIHRLQTPYYEEARQYWKQADADHFFAGMKPHVRYIQETLCEIIRSYGEREVPPLSLTLSQQESHEHLPLDR